MLLDVALLVGAAARLTRLAVVDSIAGPGRNAVRWAGRTVAGDRGLAWADELVTCPHCAGFWIAAAVVATYAAWGTTVGWRIAAGALALSYGAGHLSAALDGEDQP